MAIITGRGGSCNALDEISAAVPKRNNGLRIEILRPLPVDCWDWTGGLRATASARAMTENPLPGLGWTYLGLGRKASGLSHLT